jgi:hypothetical protein
MEQFPINWWAVIVAAILRMVIGTVWYSPVAFGKRWQALTGITQDKMMAGLPRAIITDLILSLIMAFVLLHAVHYGLEAAGQLGNLWLGALVGFLNWLGFVFTIFVGLWAYESRGMRLTAINAGFNLIAMVLMGAILAGWQ